MEVNEPSANYLKTRFKRTEAGDIPTDWIDKPIGEIAQVTSGGTPNRKVAEFWDGEIPWITTAELDGGEITESSQHITAAGLDNSAAKWLPAGTLLMALYGQGKTRGKCAVLRIAATTNQACAGIKLNDSVDSDFIRHNLTYRYDYIRSLSNGGSQENLSGEIVKKIRVGMPSAWAEQRAIAAALTDADALIDSLEQLLAKKRQIKQGAMQELLTGKRRLPGFQQEWRSQPFDVVLERINAKRHQIQASEYQAVGALPVIDQGQKTPVAYSDAVGLRFRCPVGGALIFGDHTCITKFVNFDFVVGADGVQVLIARQGQSTHFHAYQLELNGIESTGYNRHFKFLLGRYFLCPAIDEQTAIAQVLSDMDADIAETEARLTKARDLKQAMAQALLTGRVRLV